MLSNQQNSMHKTYFKPEMKTHVLNIQSLMQVVSQGPDSNEPGETKERENVDQGSNINALW